MDTEFLLVGWTSRSDLLISVKVHLITGIQLCTGNFQLLVSFGWLVSYCELDVRRTVEALHAAAFLTRPPIPAPPLLLTSRC